MLFFLEERKEEEKNYEKRNIENHRGIKIN